MTRRYIVRASDPTKLSELLARFGEAAESVAEGRVFVGRERAHEPARAVSIGEEVVVEQRREGSHDIEVISEWNGLVAVYKPPGLATEPDRRGATSLITLLADRLSASPRELHAVTRLDLPVSGLVVVAKGRDAARLAADLKRTSRLLRRYVALAGSAPTGDTGTWTAPIGRDARRRPAIGGRDARPAETRYRVVSTTAVCALLSLEPQTGRTHQLRLHAAHAGAPLLGDSARGPSRVVASDGRVIGVNRVMLHAAHVRVAGGTWSASARVPHDFQVAWQELGGGAESLEEAALPG